ncbi:MAG TPA: FoF1 ATP synthase subunit a [Spirochaetia bacterium]|nr:FoF1 ATP synthase subunit a [Spirochaetia bacterium]
MPSQGPETLLTVAGFHVTNTLLTTLLVDLVIVLIVVLVRRRLSLAPGKLQAIVESVVEYLQNITEPVAGLRTGLIFPWVFVFFFFVALSNLVGLLPGFGTIGFTREGGFVPLLHVSTSDLNLTLALAIVSVVATNVISIRTIGVKQYLRRFIVLTPLFFVGLLELLQELTKFVTFSFRLFGNISAGEMVLGTMSSILAFIVPVPFLAFEVLVALIQGLVFSLLTMAFMTMLTEPHHTEEKS